MSVTRYTDRRGAPQYHPRPRPDSELTEDFTLDLLEAIFRDDLDRAKVLIRERLAMAPEYAADRIFEAQRRAGVLRGPRAA